MACRVLNTSMNTILVVDDDRLLRESLIELLDDLGCHSLDAANGDSALALFDLHACDLVISDVDMPDMSGFELLARLRLPQRQRAQTTPLIFLSARADDQLSRAAHAAGAVGLFPKPVPVAGFTSALRGLLNLA
ncbi:MAG: response regulator [Planctomycetota bacterium]|nr:MAG: response regulator [Planctomycetota bacterium]